MSNQLPEPTSEEFVRGVEQLAAQFGKFDVSMPYRDACIIIKQLQLALRHPANVGESRYVTLGVLENWIGHLELANPVVGRTMRLGMQVKHDVPPIELVTPVPLPQEDRRE